MSGTAMAGKAAKLKYLKGERLDKHKLLRKQTHTTIPTGELGIPSALP